MRKKVDSDSPIPAHYTNQPRQLDAVGKLTTVVFVSLPTFGAIQFIIKAAEAFDNNQVGDGLTSTFAAVSLLGISALLAHYATHPVSNQEH